MEDHDELDTYNRDTEHNMWVYFDRYENTGDLLNIVNDSDLDNYIENLNDWD